MNKHVPIGATALLAVAALATAALAGPEDQRLDIYWVDVEGGAATLIVTPAGETVLIDTGSPGQRDPERIRRVVCDVAGRDRIDYLIVTHYDIDHAGGAARLATLLPIGTVYDNGRSAATRRDPGGDYWRFKCAKRCVIGPGHRLPVRQSRRTARLSLLCIAASQRLVEPAADAVLNRQVCEQLTFKEPDRSENANSVVMLLQFGPFRFFDAADLTWNLEARLVCPVNLIGSVDVYQVTHHGLDRSNNPVVVRSLQPTVAVMNNGVTKGCSPGTFATLRATKSIQAIYQLHKNLRPDGQVNNTADQYIANLKRDCDGNYIKLSVDPAGRSYTVSIPARGHRRTYRTRGASGQ